MVRLTVNDRPVVVAEGASLLDAAHSVGITVPTLCHDPRLPPSGACRLCVVDVAGHPRPLAACTTPAAEGMVVSTTTDDLERWRHTTLTMLAEPYPADAVVAQPEQPFHRLLADAGIAPRGARRPGVGMVDDSHPLIHVDLAQCVSCWRCVSACEDLQGQFVWRIDGRGARSRIVPDGADGLLGTSSCVACGACVDTCPTGALADASAVQLPPPTAWTRTTCPYCGVGCELEVGTNDGEIVSVSPAIDAPANHGHACVKGRFGHGFVGAADRVTEPMIRIGGRWQRATWAEAIAEAAAQLRRVVDRDGPAAVGVLGSARATNEDNYAAQKFARVVLGTNNVDCCARVCHAPSAAALRAMLGTGAATSSYDDIDEARTILVFGANPTENHPVVGARIKHAVRRGAHLILVDPRCTELAAVADVHLRPRPGTNVALLNALCAVVVDEGLVDAGFVEARTEGFEQLRAFLTASSVEALAAECGVGGSAIRAAARLYATGGPAISFHGLGLTEQRHGTDGVMALTNLALITGNVGRAGTGVNPLRGQNNVQGAAHMGCDPLHLPGYVPIAEGRDRIAGLWGADVPSAPGLDAMEMVEAAATGRLRALYVVGWDVLLTNPNVQATRRGLGALDSLIVQDLFLNETARAFGTVFLPAASAFEKDGTFMSSERRVQRVRAAVPARGAAKPDWEIVCAVAEALGAGPHFRYPNSGAIWEEIRTVWAPGAGISAEALGEPGGRQWPCPTVGHPGTTRLHGDRFATADGRALLQVIPARPLDDEIDDEYPMVLVTGRSLYAFNAGTMTGRSAVHQLRPTDTAQLHPDDAVSAGVSGGDCVRIVSRHGSVVLPAEITDVVPRGVVFATFHDPATMVNRLTGPSRDSITNTPAYKHTPVWGRRQRTVP